MLHALPPRAALRSTCTKKACPLVASIARCRRTRVPSGRRAASGPVGTTLATAPRTRPTPSVEGARIDAVRRTVPLDVSGVTRVAGATGLAAPLRQAVRCTCGIRGELTRALVALGTPLR